VSLASVRYTSTLVFEPCHSQYNSTVSNVKSLSQVKLTTVAVLHAVIASSVSLNNCCLVKLKFHLHILTTSHAVISSHAVSGNKSTNNLISLIVILFGLLLSATSEINNLSDVVIPLLLDVNKFGFNCDGFTDNVAHVHHVSVLAVTSASVAISTLPATVALAFGVVVHVSTLSH